MSDMDPLYESMKDSAEDMSKAAVEMKTMMTADQNTDVNIEGYGVKPSFSKQIKNLTEPVMDAVASWFVNIKSLVDAWFLSAQNRFNWFIASSGFDEVGDYYSGPLEVKDYNKVLRYKGEAWKLNFSTPIPYVTQGNTDATWEGLDKKHFNFLGEDVLRQNLSAIDGFKWIGRCPDVNTLRSIIPDYPGQIIDLVAYYPGWSATLDGPVGGGSVYYDATDSTTADDGVLTFVTPDGHRWKRIRLDGVVNIFQGGIQPTTEDQSIRFQAIVDALSSKPKYYVLDGLSFSFRVDSGAKIDIFKVGVKDLTYYSNNAAPVSRLNMIEILGASSAKVRAPVFERVDISGPTARSTADINGAVIKPSSSLANAVLGQLRIQQVNRGVVLGSNAYLITFNDLQVYRSNICLTDTVVAGIESTITNAGENIRFNDTVFANSNAIMHLQAFEGGLCFYKPSWDYTGGGISSAYKQVILGKNGISLTLLEPHIESGNGNDGVTDDYFYFTAPVKFRVEGGRGILGSSYNNIPNFINDVTNKSAISVDGFYPFGLGVKQWLNAGARFDRFNPVINFDNSTATAKIGGAPVYLVDNTFSDPLVLDNWYVSGTQTSRLTSNHLNVQRVAIDDGNGNTVNALSVTREAGQSGTALRLQCKVISRSKFSPSIRAKLKMATDVNLSVPVFFNVYLAKQNGVTGPYGTPVYSGSRRTWQSSRSTFTTVPTETVVQGQLVQVNANMMYTDIVFEINTDGLIAGQPLYITEVNIDLPY